MKMKLLLDTNIIIDFINRRDPHYEKVRLLMMAGRVGEFDLWLSSSQVTDLIYVLSDGEKKSLMPTALESMRKLRSIVRILPVSEADIDRMLGAGSTNPEDTLLVECAIRLGAAAIITRDKDFPKSDVLHIFSCDELFSWLEREHGLVYSATSLPR